MYDSMTLKLTDQRKGERPHETGELAFSCNRVTVQMRSRASQRGLTLLSLVGSEWHSKHADHALTAYSDLSGHGRWSSRSPKNRSTNGTMSPAPVLPRRSPSTQRSPSCPSSCWSS